MIIVDPRTIYMKRRTEGSYSRSILGDLVAI
ncbi:uncharacterized protein METZ01_LOCUS517676 [marine metagenome]|uniref:Uncharacterized protein n=1 Tax=marine metagenome TaxID=408172 RepID=A0A383F6K9_9ZZZZ